MNSHKAATRKAWIDLFWAAAFVLAVALAVFDYWSDGNVNLFNFITICFLALSYAGQQLGEALLALRYTKKARQVAIRRNILRDPR